MSGMLRPVGPEPARTYWVRRGILVLVVLLVAAGVVMAVASLTRAATATAPPPMIAAPADSPTASVEPDPTTSVTLNPTTSNLTPTTPGSPTGADPSVSVTTPAGTSGAAVAHPTGAPTATTSAPSASSPPATPKPKVTAVGTPDCLPAELTVAVKGAKTLTSGKTATFRLSLTNAGKQTCLTSITRQNFELKIYSGKDRIWSSQDCAKTLAPFDKKLASGASAGWVMTWEGHRSVKGEKCRRDASTPRAGTYWATAQLHGAEPAQLRMVLS